MFFGKARNLFIIPVVFMIVSCGGKTGQDVGKGNGEKENVSKPITVAKAEYKHLSNWNKDNVSEALVAFKKSCDKFLGGTSHDFIKSDYVIIDYKFMENACNDISAFALKDNSEARKFFEKWFVPYRVYNEMGKDKGTFTGYYEASLDGDLKPTCEYLTPLYAKPCNEADQSYTRADIENGALRGKAPVLFWVDSSADAFLLQIQGSGIVKLKDGRMMRVGYAGNNGQQFKSLSSIMQEKGIKLDEGYSMIGMKNWLEKNPQQAQEIINQNPRYIFFREVEGDGPIGSQGVPLTPKRSIAVDTSFIPLGIPMWVDVKDPDGEKLDRMVIAQDTGTAIKGAIRADFFWGYGDGAFAKAARMKSDGSYFVMLPKDERAFTVRQNGYLF